MRRNDLADRPTTAGAVVDTPDRGGGDGLELTILMPCLCEAETLAACIGKAHRFLDRTGVAGEVLVADNGSDDGSPEIARAHAARAIEVPQPGYGSALIQGIAAARGRYVILGDADDSYDFDALDDLLAELRAGADLVMGNRFRGGIRPGAMPWLHRYVGNPVLSFVGRLFFGCKLGDFHCGLRGVRRESAQQLDLRTTGMEFASELVVKALLANQRIAEVPVVLHPDGRSRPPHLRSWSDGWRHLRFLMLFSPRWLLLYPGLLLSVMGLAGLGLLGSGAVSPGRGRFSEGLLVAAGGLVVAGFQSVQFSLLARVFAATQRLLPPLRRNLSSVVDRLSFEIGLMTGSLLVALSIGSLTASLFMSRTSDPNSPVASPAFRLGTCAVVLGVLGVQVILGATFLSILNLQRMGTAAPLSRQGSHDRGASSPKR